MASARPVLKDDSTRPGRRWSATSLDRGFLLLACAIAGWRYLQLHSQLSPAQPPAFAALVASPYAPVPGFGWWSGWDQGKYLEAALAWTHGALEPAMHWYLPGYPLLGALFARVTPAQPFLVPDLACLIAALWVFTALAERLLGRMRHARALAATVFLATTVLPPRLLGAWVTPWTTTPEAALLLAALLAAVRFASRPRAADAFWAALAGVAVAAFRPADAAVIVGVCASVMAWALWRGWPGLRGGSAIAAAAVMGAALPAAGFGGAYLAIYGLHASPYTLVSAAIGFEWRLLPLRWVTLMIDPQPLFPDGRGLAAVFPWIAPGLAGMVVALIRPGVEGRTIHLLTIGACLLDWVMLLTYRDLHPPALWRQDNFHYFKWMLPIFGLYAVVLLRACVLAPRWLPPAVATGIGLVLFMWRVEVTDLHPLPRARADHATPLPSGLTPIDAVVFAAAAGDPAILYGWDNEIRSGGAVFKSTLDFKIFPLPNAFMLIPLRPMPGVDSLLQMAWQIDFDLDEVFLAGRQRIVWGFPCWVAAERPACRFASPLPPPALPLDGDLLFASGGNAAGYLVAGWSGANTQGRWTDGGRASLRLGVGGLPPGAALTLDAVAQGYVPEAADPVQVGVFANGIELAHWRFGAETTPHAHAFIPAGVIRPNDALRLDFVIANPRMPSVTGGGADLRELGIMVRAMHLSVVPPP